MNNIQYKCNPKHRTGLPKIDRTIWIVSEQIEEGFFRSSVVNNYKCLNHNFWWIEKKHIGQTDTKMAFIAKFKSDNNNLWHGYPVTAERTPYDRPPTTILEEWLKKDLLRRKNVSDIKRGRGYADTI